MNEGNMQIIFRGGHLEYAVVPVKDYPRMVALLEDRRAID